MTRETKIGLLVGLGFIIMFGLILGEHTNAWPEQTGAMTNVPGPNGVHAGDDGRMLAATGNTDRHDDLSTTGNRRQAPDEDPGYRRDDREQHPADRTGRADYREENLDGIRRTVEEMRRQPGQFDPPVARVRTYVIKRNDTLWAIAQRELGNGNEWHKIQDANPGVTSDPNTLPIGKEIVIPQ